MKYNYKSLYEKNAKLYTKYPLLQRALQPTSHVLTAIFAVAYALLLYTALTTPYEVRQLIPLICAPAVCLTVVTILRYAINRPRPYAENGAQITPFSTKKNSADNSFPSRHVACAFVIATLFLSAFTAIGCALFVLAVLLAYIRFTLGVHYPTDLLCGMAIGIVCGLWIFI
ncbi:MAG: phosphatase PAP2 family protein [Clostridia bacterium]|nr:phosphatase PAP2 family protein [Clostridia bacterium]